jgi:DNA mismatch repair protein MutS
MCGVPVHAAEQYLQKLIRLEHRVAVCEQMEDPQEAKRRGGKSVVRRSVIRLVTPGTLTEDTLLESRSSNYIAALAVTRGTQEMALSWAEISSGEFSVLLTDHKRLAAELARLEPARSFSATACGAIKPLRDFGGQRHSLEPAAPPPRFAAPRQISDSGTISVCWL